jgi:hypothetical protein
MLCYAASPEASRAVAQYGTSASSWGSSPSCAWCVVVVVVVVKGEGGGRGGGGGGAVVVELGLDLHSIPDHSIP